MRRALVIGLVTAVTLTAVGTAGAATPRERAQIQARASLERALALFRGGYSADPREGTMVLRQLRMSFGRLSPADREVAKAILARPTDGHNGDWTAPKSARKHVCKTHFCIHWVKKTRDAPSLADANHDGIPNYVQNVINVMNHVWAREITELAYPAPMGDGNSGSHHGGNPNNKVDIYLQDVGAVGLYGYCTTDDPRFGIRNDVSAYCVYDDDFSPNQFGGPTSGLAALKVTAAHEFHHAIQFGMDVREDAWFMEATATNMEATVYPAIHDNYQYLKASPISGSAPWRSLDLFSRNLGTQYGSWIFFRYLCEWAMSPTHPLVTEPDCKIVHEIWDTAAATPNTLDGNDYSTRAIANTLAGAPYLTSFEDQLREFGVANAAPAEFYKDGGLYPTAKKRNFAPNPLTPGSGSSEQTMFHMASDYMRYVPDVGATTATFDLDFPASPYMPLATALTYDTGGSLTSSTQISLDPTTGDGSSGLLAFAPASVGKIVIVLTNAGRRFKCNTGTTFSCHGKPRDDSPRIANSSKPYDYKTTITVG